MSADTDHRDKAVAELEQTTVSGKAWVQGGRKPGHWKTAMDELAQIGAVTPNPPPPPPPTATPLWGFDENTTDFKSVWDSVQAKPYNPANCSNITKFGTITDQTVQGVKMRRFDVPGVTTGEQCQGTAISKERAQAYKLHSLDEGQTGVYSYTFVFPARTVSMGGVYLIAETNAQFVLQKGPTFSMFWNWGGGSPYVDAALQAGIVRATSPVFEVNQRHMVIPAAVYQPDVQWQIITAVEYQRQATGSVEVWYRVRGATAWQKPVDIQNIKTLQTNPDGSVPATSGMQDVIAAYRAASPNPAGHSCRQMLRWKTVQDALPYMDTH